MIDLQELKKDIEYHQSISDSLSVRGAHTYCMEIRPMDLKLLCELLEECVDDFKMITNCEGVQACGVARMALHKIRLKVKL